MWNALKAKDLQRDPRVRAAQRVLRHQPEGTGRREARRARAEEVTARRRSHHTFRLDIREVSVVTVNDEQTHLIIDVWTADGGLKQIERK